MSKVVKLIISIFIGLDIFAVGYFALSQARFALFGVGQIPGGGSALDMALFLIPLFVGYVAGDRLYHFLTYRERRTSRWQTTLSAAPTKTNEPARKPVGAPAWEDRGWDESQDKM